MTRASVNKTEKCPCGSGVDFGVCCGAVLSGRYAARTAEALMRSRYTAYVVGSVDYLVQTTLPSARSPKLAADIRETMSAVRWIRLHVLNGCGEATDSFGIVEFLAEYMDSNGLGQHHERSVFRKRKGIWYYEGAEFLR